MHRRVLTRSGGTVVAYADKERSGQVTTDDAPPGLENAGVSSFFARGRDAIYVLDGKRSPRRAPKEAAMALSVAPGAVRVRVFRARARLRKEHSRDG